MIIAAAIPKGGTGKTTMLQALASIALDMDLEVVVLDADVRQHMLRWYTLLERRGNLPPKLTVISTLTDQEIIVAAEKYDSETTLVLIDTEGTTNEVLMAGLYKADIVVIPVKYSMLDVTAAIQVADEYIPQVEAHKGETIPKIFVVTQHSIIDSRARDLAEVREIIQENGTRIAKSYLALRTVYKGFNNGQTLFSQSERDEKAISESRAVFDEIVETFTQSLEG